MFATSTNPFIQLSLNMMRLGVEAKTVIGLRLFQMATGGVSASAETQRMVPEKISALADAQKVVAVSVATGKPQLAPEKVVRLYRKRVSANQKRLTKAKTRRAR